MLIFSCYEHVPDVYELPERTELNRIEPIYDLQRQNVDMCPPTESQDNDRYHFSTIRFGKQYAEGKLILNNGPLARAKGLISYHTHEFSRTLHTAPRVTPAVQSSFTA